MGGVGQQKKIRRRSEIIGFTVSHKPNKPSGFDLMQNCDLPPPSRFLMGPDKSAVLSMFMRCKGEEERDGKHSGAYNGNDEKELLKALQASQTRAREAEKKAATLKKEKEGLSMVLLEEAMHLFAYRQQLRLLELQVLHLQQSLLLPQQPEAEDDCIGHDQETTSVAWVLALVIGVTTALACRSYM